MVITMDKVCMAHASTHGARKPPGPKSPINKSGDSSNGTLSKKYVQIIVDTRTQLTYTSQVFNFLWIQHLIPCLILHILTVTAKHNFDLLDYSSQLD